MDLERQIENPNNKERVRFLEGKDLEADEIAKKCEEVCLLVIIVIGTMNSITPAVCVLTIPLCSLCKLIVGEDDLPMS